MAKKTRPAGPYPMGTVTFPTWLVRYDAKGACSSPQTRAELVKQAKNKQVILFSHGWQTDFDGAVGQYTLYLNELDKAIKALGNRVDTKNLVFAGIVWPSKWFREKRGPDMASASGPPEILEALRQDFGGAIASESEAREFYDLTDAAELDEADAKRLATLLLGVKGRIEIDEGADAAALTADDVLQIWRDIQAANGGITPTGDAGEVNFGDDDSQDANAAGGFKFNPLDAVRLFSIYQMKDRAEDVGLKGVASLITDLAATAARLHLVGHSFGCKVMLAGVNQNANRARKPQTLTLLQGAVSRLLFADSLPNGLNRPGGYRDVPKMVEKKVLTTFSKMDDPLRNYYHLALRRPRDLGEDAQAAGSTSDYAALGGYGPTADFTEEKFPELGAVLQVPAGPGIIRLDGSKDIITDHVDVANRYTAALMASMLI